MGVQKHEQEITSSVSAEKMFNGLILDIDNILPKAAPGAYKNVEIKGDGGVGTIKHITLADGGPITTMTLRTDGLDKKAFTTEYSIIDGDVLLGFIDKIENHLSVVPTADGGSITKTTAIFHTKGDAVVPEENIKYADAQNAMLFKAVEAYLLAN
ncbi:Major allergen Pru ar 1 [Heracleum sosnowskyi]|uniref:Major allergen Pru ar 1 n=1 Tax=Heracleum sosnowskyi TaxID=360622 RepID=A0AAD8MZE3_9APIA|nr:Major allergen Pru ar 1 [Heracleum sosnowskyi]KAK1390436.1 Major allergen Pru ar 1 [Heracleum sosnowskyi]KAK1390437.1 Major allergen Pru ar 1 [Heracleum sosnowskyi]